MPLSGKSILTLVSSFAIIGCSIVLYLKTFAIDEKKKRSETVALKAYLSLIGNTQLVELPQLSKFTGCRIFAKVSVPVWYSFK